MRIRVAMVEGNKIESYYRLIDTAKDSRSLPLLSKEENQLLRDIPLRAFLTLERADLRFSM